MSSQQFSNSNLAGLSPSTSYAQPSSVICTPMAQQTACPQPVNTSYTLQAVNGCGVSGWGAWLLWFIILIVIIFVILWLINPVGLQQTDLAGIPNGERNAGKIFGASFVLALIILFIVWLVKSVRC